MNTLRLLIVITLLTLLSMIPLNAYPVSNGGFETGDFTDWSTTGETFLVDNKFGTGPAEGTHQAVLTTLGETGETTDGFTISGIDAVPVEDLETLLGLIPGDLSNLDITEGAAIQQEFKAKKGEIISFVLNFLTDEPLSPTAISDRALVVLDGDLYDLANMSPAFLGTSGTEFLDETGFFPFTHRLSKSGSHKLAIVVADHTDNIGASALVVDNIVLTTDIDVCEGLAANAWGLCTAAYAGNCDEVDPSNPLTACAQLAEQYRDETGEEPPWVEIEYDVGILVAIYVGENLQTFTDSELQSSSDAISTQDDSGVVHLSTMLCDPSNYWCSNIAAVRALRAGYFPGGTTVNFNLLAIKGLPNENADAHCRLDRLPNFSTIAGTVTPIPSGSNIGDNIVTLPADEPDGIVLHCEITSFPDEW